MNLWRRVWPTADFGYGDLLRFLLGILCSSMISFNFRHPAIRQSAKHLAVRG